MNLSNNGVYVYAFLCILVQKESVAQDTKCKDTANTYILLLILPVVTHLYFGFSNIILIVMNYICLADYTC